MRTDCTQLILGLLVDQDGIPLGFEVYPGNTFEGKTLFDIVDKMRNKFNVKRFVFVADRGLFSESNLKKLSDDGVEFVVGMKLGSLGKAESDAYDIERFDWISGGKLAVREIKQNSRRCIVTWSKDRCERDGRKRKELIEKIQKKLSGKSHAKNSYIESRL